MITVDIQNIRLAVASEHLPSFTSAFSTVRLITENGAANLYLPAGTAAAVAACINVAVAAGQPAQIEADEVAA